MKSTKGFGRIQEMNHRLHGLASLTFAIFSMAWAAVAADPGITVSARQRYPWNGLVDVHFTITGDAGTKYDTSFTAKDMVGNTNIAMRTIRKADGTAAAAKEQLMPDTYNWVWDAAADLPDGFECERVTVTGTADIAPFPYSVKFNANGGSGTMANESFTYGTAKALTANAFTRTDYTFQGWATSVNGAKVYEDQQSVSNLTETIGAVVNLYAVWMQDKVQLWENGPYWASKNVGASKPWEYGYYFWWGDTVGHKRQGNAWIAANVSSSNIGFSFISDPWDVPTSRSSLSDLRREGWIVSKNGIYVLAPAHDAAQAQWGGSWRMPTDQELSGLTNRCNWTWTTMNGVKGYIVCGKGAYASNSIFLPAAGIGDSTALMGAGYYGYYWSSVPDPDMPNAMSLDLGSGKRDVILGARHQGQSIRPVQ